MTQSSEPSADHARHDRLVVVRYLDLDDDLLASEVSQARAQLASCPDCAALATELQLITDATSRMVLPARPRDFRLTPQQASALQPGGLRRLLENAAGAFRFEFLRPVAGVAMAIGLLLAVVGALPQTGAAPSADFSAAGANPERAAALPQPTAAPAAMAAGTPLGNADAQPTAAPVALPSPAWQVAAQPTGAPAAIGSSRGASLAPATGTDTGNEPLTMPLSSDPAAAPTTVTVTALGPAGSPEVAGVPPAQSNGGGALQAAPDQHSSTISPLMVLGLLLAAVGLLVMLLTFVARRIARSTG